MITIKTEENIEKIDAFLKKQGVSEDLGQAIAMTARDGEQILALGALSMWDYKVFLDHLVLSDAYADDKNLAIGLLKSLLNLADLRGIKTVYGANPTMFDYYKMLRFKPDDAEMPKIYTLSLEGYFQCEHV